MMIKSENLVSCGDIWLPMLKVMSTFSPGTGFISTEVSIKVTLQEMLLVLQLAESLKETIGLEKEALTERFSIVWTRVMQ
jgi:hypothetical protein